MRTKLGIIACAIGIFSYACSSIIPPQTPAQTVFELKTAEGVALSIAVQYRTLPLCPINAPICHSEAVVAQIQNADAIAAKAIDAAETASRAQGYPQTTIRTLISAATTAMATLTSLSQTLRIK